MLRQSRRPTAGWLLPSAIQQTARTQHLKDYVQTESFAQLPMQSCSLSRTMFGCAAGIGHRSRQIALLRTMRFLSEATASSISTFCLQGSAATRWFRDPTFLLRLYQQGIDTDQTFFYGTNPGCVNAANSNNNSFFFFILRYSHTLFIQPCS